MKLLKKIKQYWKAWRETRLSEKNARELTLYPESPHKSLNQIRSELYWLCRNPKRGSWSTPATIDNYFNMGLDRKGEDIHSYVFRAELDKARNNKQPNTRYITIDKWVTAQYLQRCGIATTNPLFVKSPFVSTNEALSIIYNSGHNMFFAKPVDGSLGKGAFPFVLKNKSFEVNKTPLSGEELITKLEGCIVEPYIEQHHDINAIYPHAVSSLRIVTVCEKEKIDIILASLFIGAGNSNTSNLHQGGLRLPISESGVLPELALRTNGSRGWYKCHPDTGFVFKNFQIPYWKEVTNLAIQAHACFPKFHSIGWDIAISKNGPLIIEANYRWIPHTFQYMYGAGRKYMEKYFLK